MYSIYNEIAEKNIDIIFNLFFAKKF